MGYELYLRRADPAAAPPAPAELEAAFRETGVRGTAGGYQLPAGEALVPLREARGEAHSSGFDVEIPFGAPEADFRAALLAAAKLGARLGLVLLDPQLGEPVTPARGDAVVEAWRRANVYAVETAGVVEDPRSTLPLPAPPRLVSPRARLMLIGLGMLVVAYLILDVLLTHLLRPGLKPID